MTSHLPSHKQAWEQEATKKYIFKQQGGPSLQTLLWLAYFLQNPQQFIYKKYYKKLEILLKVEDRHAYEQLTGLTSTIPPARQNKNEQLTGLISTIPPPKQN